MNSRTLYLCAQLFACTGLMAQTQIQMGTQAREINFSGAPYTRPVKTGTTLPATCNVGDMFFKVDTPPGRNLYGCAVTNTWSGETGISLAAKDLNDFLPTVSSGILTIQPGRLRFGTFPCTSFTRPITAQISSGTGDAIATLYVSDSCAVVMEYPNTLTLALTLDGITAAAVSTPGVPSSAFYIGDLIITGGVITSVVDKRSMISTFAAMAGPGVVLDCASGPCLISVDPATVAQLGGSNIYAGVQDSRIATKTFPSRLAASDPPLCVIGEQYFNTATSTMKYCTVANNWTPAAAIAYSGTAPITVTGTTINGGGLGTVTGALKGNGSGTITQAGCADLANAGTGCSATLTAVATSGSAADLTTGILPTARLSAIPNSALANSATTVSGQSCALGGTCTIAASGVTNALDTSVVRTANTIYSGPTTGSPAPGTFRALVAADLPTITALGTVTAGVWNGTAIGVTYGGTGTSLAATGGTSQVFRQSTVGGNVTVSQLACADLANAGTGCSATLAAVATSGSAADLTTGILPTARLSAIPNSVLANSSTTVNGQTCTLGAACTLALSSVNLQSSTYQVLASDFSNYKTLAVSSGTFTITLVASGTQPANGQYLDVVNYGPGVVTIARSGQNINAGTSSLTLPAASATAPTSARVVSDGTNYIASIAGPSGSSGGTPGGSTGQLQYNSSGSFAGTSNWTIGTAVGQVGSLMAAPSLTVNNGSSTGILFGLSPTYTVAAGNDAKVMGGIATISGPAQAGSTWSYNYNTCSFTLTTAGSFLDHPLCNVFRQNLTTPASTTTNLSATVYVTNDAASVAGTVSSMAGIAVTNGGVMNGTGTITKLDGIQISGPTAVTGGLTLSYQTGLATSDIAGGGAGVHRQSIAIGGAISANAGLAITVAGATTAGSNYGIYNYARNNFAAGSIVGDGNIPTYWAGGGLTAAQRYSQVATNLQPATSTYYNGVGGWDVGLMTTGSRFGITDGNAVEHLTILHNATARIGIDRIAPNFPLDVNGTASATLFNTSAGGSITIGAGVGSVKMSTANAATNAVWIPMAYNGTTYYVPAWSTNTP